MVPGIGSSLFLLFPSPTSHVIHMNRTHVRVRKGEATHHSMGVRPHQTSTRWLDPNFHLQSGYVYLNDLDLAAYDTSPVIGGEFDRARQKKEGN